MMPAPSAPLHLLVCMQCLPVLARVPLYGLVLTAGQSNMLEVCRLPSVTDFLAQCIVKVTTHGEGCTRQLRGRSKNGKCNAWRGASTTPALAVGARWRASSTPPARPTARRRSGTMQPLARSVWGSSLRRTLTLALSSPMTTCSSTLALQHWQGPTGLLSWRLVTDD